VSLHVAVRSTGVGLLCLLTTLLVGCGDSPDPVVHATVDSNRPAFQVAERSRTVAIYNCMLDAGWQGVLGDEDNPTGGNEIGFPAVPDEQRPALNAALSQCIADLGPMDTGFDDPTVLRETYEWMMGQYDCLVDAGYSMPEPPSWTVFNDTYKSEGAVLWDPIGDAAESRPSTQSNSLAAAQAACPNSTAWWG
jgi:hypothetical protein